MLTWRKDEMLPDAPCWTFFTTVDACVITRYCCYKSPLSCYSPERILSNGSRSEFGGGNSAAPTKLQADCGRLLEENNSRDGVNLPTDGFIGDRLGFTTEIYLSVFRTPDL
ncbi:hypothetical protein MTP99_014882 [Tenebrio molitor]|nr:hypothetical protein MTP99_014882 [Tenebrio molitor]